MGGFEVDVGDVGDVVRWNVESANVYLSDRGEGIASYCLLEGPMSLPSPKRGSWRLLRTFGRCLHRDREWRLQRVW
jgi:hypothetical protein